MEKHITTPLTDEKVRELHAGDYVYLSGTVYTARDAAHKRMYEAMQRGEEIPIDLNNNIIYYLGPSPAREGQVIGSAGPTTSSRMVYAEQHGLSAQAGTVLPQLKVFSLPVAGEYL